MKLFLKTIALTVVMAFFTACGSDFEWFPEANKSPVAYAGTNQSVVVGAVVTLDGSASSDENGDKLTYSWAFTSKPTDSAASLLGAITVSPTFTADKAGSYVLSLIVNDGEVNSIAASVTVTATATTSNTVPVANAGTDKTVTVGAVVTLNGSTSSDANGDTLTYSWSFTSKPDGSSAALSSTSITSPTFTADIAGSYVISLVVNDGTLNSAADSVSVTAAVNVAPMANAGPDQSVTPGTIVQLDGSNSSDANGDELRYNWRRTSPSCGDLSNSTAVNPTLTGSTTGTCIIELQVFDHAAGSEVDTVAITITQGNGSITVTW